MHPRYLRRRADVYVAKVNHRCLVYNVNNGNPLLFDPARPSLCSLCSRRPYLSLSSQDPAALYSSRQRALSLGCLQEGDGELYPTVYLIWQFPKCLPSVWTYSEVRRGTSAHRCGAGDFNSEWPARRRLTRLASPPRPLPLPATQVSPKVLGGADLMLPGFIMDDTQDWEQGQKMVCSVKDHPIPFAVGFMEQSSKASRDSGMKGRGLKVLHHFPDTLWALGDKSVPDPSFTATRVYPMARTRPPRWSPARPLCCRGGSSLSVR